MIATPTISVEETSPYDRRMDYFDPVSLRLFVAICEKRSFSEAADREHLTTSAVSKRLAALEEQIGAPLLERSRRGVKLTAAGEALLPAARSLLQSMSRIHAQLSEYAGGVQGHVRVAASLSAIASYLPEDIGAFKRRHGATVRVSLDERLSPEVVRSVEEGSADLGVYWDAIGTSKLQTVPYRADRLVVLVHKDHELARRKRLSFNETLQYERVAIKGGSIVQLTQQRLALAEGAALKFHIQVGTFDAACRIVAANLAIAVVPGEASRPLIRAFGLKAIPLTDEWALRRFVICVRDRDMLAAPARLLLDALAARWYDGDPPPEE
jgi:DNA-binding transcriptional LysR family regulator